MNEQEQLVHGIVLYTISDESTRESIENFIKKNLNGVSIDQSSFSLPRTGDMQAKTRLRRFIDDHSDFSFGPEDFIRICYAYRLIGIEANKDDQIIIYKII